MIVRLTSRFGEVSEIHPKPHTGIDLAFPEGSPLHSVGNDVDPISFVEKFIDYGRIGDGIGDLKIATLKEWLGGQLAEITLDRIVGYVADLALALPFLVIVGGSVYALLHMVSRRLASFGAVGSLLYGIIIIN